MRLIMCSVFPILSRQKHLVRLSLHPRSIIYRFISQMSDSEYAKLFSGKQIAQAYARFRPDYSVDVYKAILTDCKNGDSSLELAVDIGCGTGQSTVPLAKHFKQVIGMDVSVQQIKQAESKSHPSNIKFRVGPAEDLTSFTNNSVDLVTIAQALHWLNLDKFYPEVSRVLRPGGTIAAYGYGIWKLDNLEAEESVLKFYNGPLGPYWGMGRKHVEEKYSQISLPFPGWKRKDDIWLEKIFSVEDFCGYMSSWSAYHKYKGDNPEETELSNLSMRLKKIYEKNSSPAGSNMITARWPVFLLIGQKPV